MTTAKTTQNPAPARQAWDREREAEAAQLRLQALAAYGLGLEAYVQAEKAYLAALRDVRVGQVELARVDAERHAAAGRLMGYRISL